MTRKFACQRTPSARALDPRAAPGEEFSQRGFRDRFAGKQWELGIPQAQLNGVLGLAKDRGHLIQRPPRTPMRNVPLVLAVPEPAEAENTPAGDDELCVPTPDPI